MTNHSVGPVTPAGLPALTGTVSITGNAVVGETLTANTAGLGGTGTTGYQWRRGTTEIGTNSSTYTVQAGDVGYTITVTVIRAGYSGSETSPSVGPVTAAGLPPLTGTVSITGDAVVGQTLTADITGLVGTGTPSFQWQREGTDIGTDSGTYTVQAGDVGYYITVTVTLAGNSGSETSDPVGPVALPRFVRVEGGTFDMGYSCCCTSPQSVTVSTFYISRFQLTQGEWYDVMDAARPSYFDGTNRCNYSGVTPTFDWRDLPVEQVSWYDALVFANRLSVERGLTPAYELPNVYPNPTSWSSDLTTWGPVPTTSEDARWDAVRIAQGSTGYRLPTEAEWEFAARGGNVCQGNYEFSGGDVAYEVAWYDGNSGERTHPVGLLRPNALGIHDMSGNVMEWVWDLWSPYFPWRGLRGGHWGASDGSLRSVSRDDAGPTFGPYYRVGIRLVRPAL